LRLICDIRKGSIGINFNQLEMMTMMHCLNKAVDKNGFADINVFLAVEG
jgi:hypothetical protein